MRRIAPLILLLPLAFASPVDGQSQSPIRSHIYTLPPQLARACAPELAAACNPADLPDAALPEGGGAGFSVFSQAAAALNFVEAIGIEVGATALSLEVAGSVTTSPVLDETGAATNQIRVDTAFWSIQLLNRAAVTLDSLQSLANDYLTSLQPAPVTVRVEYPLALRFGGVSLPPLILRVDGRGVPYADANGSVALGGSGHVFLGTAWSQYARSRDASGRIQDEGEVYFEPTVYGTFGSSDLINSIRIGDDDAAFFGAEVRLGYRSRRTRAFDIGVLGRCAFADLNGPACRVSIIGGTNR